MIKIYENACEIFLLGYKGRKFDLTFLDPPFNQRKDYEKISDNLIPDIYWENMKVNCEMIWRHSNPGASIYFMQREKNTHKVMQVLEDSNWTFQNLIIWKKKTSAVPSSQRFGKHYQSIVFATKGNVPKTFNKLRIDPPLLVTDKYSRPNGVYVTDVWDDIRELTSGFYAGKEPLRNESGERFHKQQSPLGLLARIILSSSKPGDLVFDPYSGTGTTAIVSRQLSREFTGTEIDPKNVESIHRRLADNRNEDDISNLKEYYRFTSNLQEIWG